MKEYNVLQKLAKRIRDLRKLKGMSQEILAEKANLHPSLIGKMERGEINPTIISLEKIAKAFNISLAELLSFPDDKSILDADTQLLDKSIEILKQVIEIAKGYKQVGP
jgi:transcriptional regulator with XRE-family HTH domain